MKRARSKNDADSLRQVILDYLLRKCRACTIAFIAVASIVTALVATETLWRPVLTSWQAPLEIVTIAPSSNAPGMFDVVVRNSMSQPTVVTGVELAVTRVEPSIETMAGSSSLPVAEHFDAMLDPKVGSISSLQQGPFQVSANSLDRFQVRLGTRPINRSARIRYRLVMRLQVNGDWIVRSTPFEAMVPVL